MNYIFSLISETLIFFDVFKSPIYLLFDKQQKISTKTGGIISISILAFLLTMTFKSDLFQKNAPKLLISDLPQPNRQKVIFDKKIIAIGLQNENGVGFIDPSIYTIELNLIYKNNGTNYVIENQPLEIHECAKSDFDNQINIFEDLNLKNNFCIQKNQSINLEGYWDEPNLSFLQINLNICDNATKNNSCKSYDEISNFLKTKNYYNIYFEDTSIDIYDYLNPIKKSIVNEYRIADINLKKSVEFTIKNVNLFSDDGVLTEDKKLLTEVKYDEQKIDFSLRRISDIDKTIVTFEIYASKKVLEFKRNYEKITDLLSDLGGILEVLKIICVMIVNVELELNYKQAIINLLFFLPQLVGNHTNRRNVKVGRKIHPKIIVQSDKEAKKINFSLLEYLKLKIKCIIYFPKTTKEMYFMKADGKFQKKIDIKKILKRLEEINFMKKILLTNDQQKLFKHIQKPTLRLQSANEIEKKFAFKNIWERFQTMKVQNILNDTDLKILNSIDRNSDSLTSKFRKQNQNQSEDSKKIEFLHSAAYENN